MKYLITLLLCIVFTTQGIAEQDNVVEMADVMRSNGKINVVVAVLATIFIGLMIFLIRIDKKVQKLEE
jgi:hypothetical protein